MLCEGGGEAWEALPPSQRAALEELGVIGPIWEEPGRPRPDAWQKPEQRMLRNPMVADLARALLAERRDRAAVTIPETWTAAIAPETPPAAGPGSRSKDAAEASLTVGPITTLKAGDTEYVFRFPLTGVYSPAQGVLTIRGLKALAQSTGDSAVARRSRDWVNEFHLRYQRLAEKTVSEMSRREKQALRELEAMLDTQAMEKQRTITLRQTGVIQRVNKAGVTITWVDGERDTIPLDLAAESVGYRRGQRIEAIVRRSESSFDIVRVLHARPLPPLKPMTEQQADALWNSLPGGASTRPTDTWD